MASRSPSRLITTAGARAAELVLLDLVHRLRARDPGQLREPVRVVVPSRSLRMHVAASLAAGGRPLAGVVVETLGGLARALLARGGVPARRSDSVLDLLARRFAAEEAVLVESLGGIADPFAAVAASVRDLLDAGLGAEQADAAVDLLAEGAGPAAREVVLARSAAVVRVAARVAASARDLGVDVGSLALARAAEALALGAELPARAVVVYGFAETTGVAGDVVEALVRRGGAVVVVDLPPDPAAGGDAGAFAGRLVARLSGEAGVEAAPVRPEIGSLTLLEAADAETETRAVAERIRDLLDGGAAPEAIGVVVREVGARLGSIARHFDRLGVPFSGVSLAAPGGDLRARLGGLLQVLAAGDGARVDRWRESASGIDASFEVAAALRLIGATRLCDLARMEPPSRGVWLPLAAAPGAEGEEGGEEVGGTRVEAAQLAELKAGARAAVELLAAWPDPGSPAAHALLTARLLACQGGWPDEPERLFHESLEACAAELAPVGAVSRTEWARALARTTRELARVAEGGAGGGVQVLGAMEARARTFDRLFVLGLQRDAFPRPVVEDPLLPDGVRARLTVLLPEMPVKGRGHLEERYLFAQLVSSAPGVTLSWAASSGRAASPASPYVEELRAAGVACEAVPRGTLAGRPATAWESAVARGVAGDRQGWAAAMPAALAEAWSRLGGEVPSITADAASGLAAGVDELERAAGGPGPFLGLVGAGTLDPAGAAFVTRMEAVARCPWQAFVVNVLRVAPVADPLLALPALDRRLVGVVVHEALARRAVACGAAREVDLAEARRREPATFEAGGEEWIDAALADAASAVVRREGVPFPGLAPVLTVLTRPLVAAALELEAGTRVLAAEVEGRAEVAGAELRFRVDRVDVEDSGTVLTDYKTGSPDWVRLKRASSRRRRLLDAVGRGELLQGTAYAAAGPATVGRYLYLDPELPGGGVEVRVKGSDEEAAAAMETAVAAITRAWRAGAVFPRPSRVVLGAAGEAGQGPLELRESPRCAWCAVRGACVRDDSALRGRLERWLGEGLDEGGEPGSAARALWRLGVAPEAEPM